MNNEELLELAATINALGNLFVTVEDEGASVTLAESREKLSKLYEHWYAESNHD